MYTIYICSWSVSKESVEIFTRSAMKIQQEDADVRNFFHQHLQNKNVPLMSYENSKSPDKSVYSRNLIRAFIVCLQNPFLLNNPDQPVRSRWLACTFAVRIWYNVSICTLLITGKHKCERQANRLAAYSYTCSSHTRSFVFFILFAVGDGWVRLFWYKCAQL